MESAVYVVATPIGNLGDITERALEVLRSVDLIAAEDTRHSKRLLDHFSISARMTSLHEHNEERRVEGLLDTLQKNSESLAIISDAGTPLISDPGFVLVRAARERGIRVVPVPGVCAITAALSCSGLSCDRFVFDGFLPAKRKAKEQRLLYFKDEGRTVVFYESTHRILETLELMAEIYPDRRIVLARELTKRFETFLDGVAGELIQRMNREPEQCKGEFVVLMEGAELVNSEIDDRVIDLLTRLLPELPPKRAVALVADYFAVDKKALYQLSLDLKGKVPKE